MRHQGSTEKNSPRSDSVTRLSAWAIALAAAIFALVPLIFNPDAILLYVPAAFYLVKFKLLMYLSAAFLVAVLGATLSGAQFVKVLVLSPILVFLGVSALSTLFSGDAVQSLIGEANRHDGLLTLAAGVLLFYGTARFIDSRAKVRVVLVAGVTSAVIVSLYGLAQKFGLDPVPGWDIPWYDGSLRAFSTIGNPLHLAAYLTLMIGATIALYFLTDARWERALWLLALGVLAACWYYTYARGAILGTSIALPVTLWFSYQRMGTFRPLLTPLSILIIAAIAAMSLTNVDFSNSDLEAKAGGRSDAEKSLSVLLRLQIWRDTIPVILERPLLGHGPDNFAVPFERHEGEDLKVALFNPATGKPDTVDKAHNELLQITATMGLLGLAAYLWVLVSYFRRSYQSGGWPIIALSGGVLAYILQLQTAFSTIATGATFWAILGVSVAMMRIQEREMKGDGQKPSLSQHKAFSSK